MGGTKNWQDMIDRSTRILETSTGANVEQWNQRIAQRGAETEAELRAWLGEQGVTGYGQMLLVMERFGYPEFMTATAEELIAGQYADRQHLRQVLDRVIEVVSSFGEVQVQARKTYVSLETPRRQFAVVRASTRNRVDVGLRLENERPQGRLVAAPSIGNEKITVRIGLASDTEMDDEVVDLLRRAYDANL